VGRSHDLPIGRLAARPAATFSMLRGRGAPRVHDQHHTHPPRLRLRRANAQLLQYEKFDRNKYISAIYTLRGLETLLEVFEDRVIKDYLISIAILHGFIIPFLKRGIKFGYNLFVSIHVFKTKDSRVIV